LLLQGLWDCLRRKRAFIRQVNNTRHGLCSSHLEISLNEIRDDIEKLRDVTRTFKILVVEDGPFFRELFKLTLQNRFPTVEIYEAVDGEQAFRKVETLHPNLIFMDIRLPGENGLELTRKIKASHAGIMAIVFTSFDLTECRRATERYKADYFLPKGSPAIKELFPLIDSILTTHV
jgi:CheY-like chemotaxis protein